MPSAAAGVAADPQDRGQATPAATTQSAATNSDGVASAGHAASPEELSFLIDRAAAEQPASASGDPDEQLAALRERVRSDPRNTRLLCETAALCIRQGMHAEAAPYLDRALSIDAGDLDALRLRGVLALLRGRYSAADRDLSRVIDHNPADAQARAWRAATRLNLGDATAAAADATAAIEAGASSPEPHVLRCLARCRLGDVSGAEADLVEARRRGLAGDRAQLAETELSRSRPRAGPVAPAGPVTPPGP